MSDFEMADFLYPQSRFNFLNMMQGAGDLLPLGIDRSAASPANHFITLIPIRETVADKNTHDPKALPVPASSKPAANSLQRFLAVSRF